MDKDPWARRCDWLLIEISLTPSADRVVRVVAEVTGECGFGAPQVVVNRSGDREITASESYGWHYAVDLGAGEGCELVLVGFGGGVGFFESRLSPPMPALRSVVICEE